MAKIMCEGASQDVPGPSCLCSNGGSRPPRNTEIASQKIDSFQSVCVTLHPELSVNSLILFAGGWYIWKLFSFKQMPHKQLFYSLQTKMTYRSMLWCLWLECKSSVFELSSSCSIVFLHFHIFLEKRMICNKQ